MIISDDHRFAFIHIPKCAGSSVRTQLAGIDSYGGKFSDEGPDERLGYICFKHLPLLVLRDYFPDEFRKIIEYDSVAIVRDPQSKLSVHEAVLAAVGVIEHLRKKPQTLDAAYSPFLPQTSFATLNHKVFVKYLFLLDQMAEFADFVRLKTGVYFRTGDRKNESAIPRFAIVKEVQNVAEVRQRIDDWRAAYHRTLTACP